jgi:hypothetical protein
MGDKQLSFTDFDLTVAKMRTKLQKFLAEGGGFGSQADTRRSNQDAQPQGEQEKWQSFLSVMSHHNTPHSPAAAVVFPQFPSH